MGSRIMHAIIAYKVAEALNIQDQATFIIGGIAADAAIMTKDASHFYSGELQRFTRKINYEAFYKKYKNEVSKNYINGYYVHLIADDLWLQGFFIPWLKSRLEAKPELLNAYHNDFKILNAQLVEHYHLNEKLSALLKEPFEICYLQEVSNEEVTAFIPSILSDLQYDTVILKMPLTVFTMEQIVGYIETSIEKSILLLKQSSKKNLSIQKGD